MSEPKRVPLQTLEFPDSLGHAVKKDKDKKLLPSHRFTLTLPEPNEERCPEFNYTQLLKTAEKKRIKELKRKDDHTANGLDPYDDDDEDKLKAMARKFEAKYGTPTSGKKNHKFDGYTDLGAGYDENDSFIDNTDAYDEIVPDEVTTAHGGFYINSGPLEFKNANNNTVFNVRSDNDDEDESSEDDEDDDTPKRSDKRTNSSSECEEGEDVARDHPAKKQKLDEIEKKPNNDSVIRKKKKANHQSEEAQNDSLQNTRDSESHKKNAEQNRVDNLEKETNGESEEKKKHSKSNDVQRSKTTGEKKFELKKFVKKVTSNGYDSKKVEEKKEPNVVKDSKIDDAIESVVNASRVDIDESSRETTESGKSRGGRTESDGEDSEKQECPLPDCLPDDVKEICNDLKAMARTMTSKNKSFSQNINTSLFSLESKLRVLGTNTIRMQTYKHLAHYFPCTKTTLVNRAKKLHMQYQEGRVKSQLEKLKSIIDRVMPAAEEKYKKECQRIVEEKNFQSPTRESDQNDADASVNKNTDKMPPKKFPWNEESINIVREMAMCRKNYFKIARPQKESLDNFVSLFFKSTVLPLWPAGWMNLETLLQCAITNVSPKKRQKKSKDSSISSNSSVTSSGNVNNTSKSESVANNASHHASDKGKVISNSYKVNSTENSLNLTITKSNDSYNEKKQISSKHKDKSNSSLSTSHQAENATPNVPIGKITVVPTAQLLAKPSNNVEKFNPMDLTSNSSLSITPVDHQKSTATKTSEVKKDTVSIIPFTESTHNETNISQHSHYHSRQETNNQNPVMVSMPIRVLQDAAIEMTHNRKIEADQETEFMNKSDKKRDRYYDGRQKSHESKKRKRESKSDMDKSDSAMSGISYTKDDQEQKQIDETVAATNYLSQIINDDSPDKKNTISLEELLNSTPANDQEDVLQVVRSIQLLHEDLNNSPTNPSVGSSASKSIKNDIQFSLYSKNDNYKISKEDYRW